MESEFDRQPIHDRETLMQGGTPHYSGFAPRRVQKLATKKIPRSSLNIECNHFLRNSTENSAHGHAPMPYRLWKEASKHEPPFPERPDPSYNSNVWRNFQHQYGFYPTTKGQKIDDMIASMYPLNVPPPSKIGSNNYAKFLTETPIIKNEKLRKLAIERTTKDIIEFKQLRLRSDTRNPPLDQSGQIMPPVNFQKYAPRFVPPDLDPTDLAQPPAYQGETRVDVFGRQVPKSKSSQPYLWKLSYKLNNPQFNHVKQEIEKRKAQPRQHPPAFSDLKVN